MLSLPYVLGYFLGIRHFGGMFVELDTAAGSWRGTLATTLEVFLLTCLQALLAVGVYETLRGRRPAARALVQSGLVRLPALLAVVVVVFVPNLSASLSLEVPEPGWLLLIACIFFILVCTFFMVAIPAAAVEGLGVMRSIARSVELVWSSELRVIGLILTVFVVAVAAVVALNLLVEWAGIDVAASCRILVWADLLLAAFFGALFAGMATVACHDLRMSREGSERMPMAAVARRAR